MTHDTLRPRSRWLWTAAILLVVEGVAVVVMGVAELASTRADRPVVGITTGLVFLVYGAGLVLAGNGVRLARRWARGVAVFTQVLHLPIAYSFWSGRTWWVSAPIAGCAILTLVALLIPSSTRAFLAGSEAGSVGEAGSVSERPESRTDATPRKR